MGGRGRERRLYGSDYWDGRSDLEPMAAVLDHKDLRGHKNRYIDTVQRLALAEWIPSGPLALDLGCGTGRLTRWLAGRTERVVGVEISHGMLRAARGHASEREFFAHFDGARLPFRDGAFPLVLSVGVFQDLPDDARYQALAREVARCLGAGSRFFLLDQVSDSDRWPWRDAASVERLCAAAGLALVRKRIVRKGRWPLLYLIRYGLLPRPLHEAVARLELRLRAGRPRAVSYYVDCLFEFRKREAGGGEDRAEI